MHKRVPIVCLWLLMLAPVSAVSGNRPIVSGSVAVDAATYVYYNVEAPQSIFQNAAITGRLKAIGGTGNDIRIQIFRETDFINWQNDHTAKKLYDSGKVTVADVNVPLPEEGKYVVILNNTFSTMTSKTVEGTLVLHWDELGLDEETASSMIGIAIVLLVGGLIGAAITGPAVARKYKLQLKELREVSGSDGL